MAQFKHSFFSDNSKQFQKFAEDFVNALILVMENKDANATGNLQRSLDYRFVEQMDGVDLDVTGLEYYKYLDYGRKSGSFPPISAIRSWANVKGIPNEAVWPIANNIFKFGIPPRNITLEAFRKMVDEVLPRFEEEMGFSLALQLKERIDNIQDINE